MSIKLYLLLLHLFSNDLIFVTIFIKGTVFKITSHKLLHFVLIQIHFTDITFVFIVICIVHTFFTVICHFLYLLFIDQLLFMIGLFHLNSICPIDLLQQNDPHQLMGEGHF